MLVDTGLGNASSNPAVVVNIGGGIDGVLLAELQAAAFQAGDIDTVFLTHMHPDHVGWNVTRPEDSSAAPPGTDLPQCPLCGSRGRLGRL